MSQIFKDIPTKLSFNLKKAISNYLVVIVSRNYTVQLMLTNQFLFHHTKKSIQPKNCHFSQFGICRESSACSLNFVKINRQPCFAQCILTDNWQITSSFNLHHSCFDLNMFSNNLQMSLNKCIFLMRAFSLTVTVINLLNIFMNKSRFFFSILLASDRWPQNSNSLIRHKLKQRKSQPWRWFGCLVLISIDFDDFTSPFTP